LHKQLYPEAQKTGGFHRLGDVLTGYMDRQVTKRHNRYSPVIELWDSLLPAELAEHCRVDEIRGGQLKVVVDGPVYMHEIRLCSTEIVNQLGRLCPAARIRKIIPVLE